MGDISCLICGSEVSLEVFKRRHFLNGRACILANTKKRTEFTVTYTRYLTGWNLWTPQKEERCRALCALEAAKTIAKEKKLQAIA